MLKNKFYKCCAVPMCKSTSITSPEKLFIYVPNDRKIRTKWLTLARRDTKAFSLKSSCYFCEDHFDLQNDMKNYMEYSIMGIVSRIRMKPGCLPTKFACQERPNEPFDLCRGINSRRHKLTSIEECEGLVEIKTAESQQCQNVTVDVPGAKSGLLSSKAAEAQLSLQKCMPMLIQEAVECTDGDESTDSMCPSDPLESREYVNYYDSKDCVLEQLKKEYPEDYSSQTEFSSNSQIVSDNKDPLKHIVKREVKCENTNEELPLNIKEEDDDIEYKFAIKMERLEEQRLLDKSRETSTYYDVPLTNQEFQCKLCGRMFNNSIDLMEHNNVHLQLATKESNNSVQCKHCDRLFGNYDTLLVHVSDTHRDLKPKCDVCGTRFKNEINLERHMIQKHKRMSLNGAIDDHLKCKHCNKTFKYKCRLASHMKTS